VTLREWERIYLVLVATVLAMVLGIMLLKIWAEIFKMLLADWTYFVPMAIAGFGILFSIIGTMLVKITDDNAKEAQVQKH
jgi:K(+)-stimulated pyrophosphate-energized sodium pump